MTGREPTGRRPHGARTDESAAARDRAATPGPRPDRPAPEGDPDGPVLQGLSPRTHRDELARRVHVDLPRVRPEDMVTTQEVEAAPDPRGGRDTERDFMLRYGAGI